MSRIAVATITWARTPEEADLILRSLRSLSALGLPVVAADGGSAEAFVEQVRALPGFTVVTPPPGPGSGLVRQVRAALAGAAATGAEAILYTEPDKAWFFERRLPAFLRAYAWDGAGVYLAARDAASFATFPAGQRLAETALNQLCAGLLGLDGDLVYGPLILRPELVPCLDSIPDDLGWGWRIYLVAAALRRGHRVAWHIADFPCPAEQRDEDNPAARAYRLEQLAQNIRALALATREVVAIP